MLDDSDKDEISKHCPPDHCETNTWRSRQIERIEVKPNEKNTGPSADKYVRTSGNLPSVLILLQSESLKGASPNFSDTNSLSEET